MMIELHVEQYIIITYDSHMQYMHTSLSQTHGQSVLVYHIVKTLTEENIDGLASFRSLTGKILMDSLLDNLYLLYN